MACGPTSRALRPSVDRRNSRNIRIFSGGEMAALPVTVCTGQCFRHSPHCVQASISISCRGESSSPKERLSVMQHLAEFEFATSGVHHDQRGREDVARDV